MNRWEYYRELDRRRTYKRWASMFDVLGAAVAALVIILTVGLLMSLTGWMWQDLSQSIMGMINTAVSVALHPVGDAVIQLS